MPDDRLLISRALDAEVQREIFGHTDLTDDTRLAVPPCSTGHMGHTWTIVDKLREWGFYLVGHWTATFNGAINEDGDDQDFDGVGPTAQVALCRAGLAVAAFWQPYAAPCAEERGGGR